MRYVCHVLRRAVLPNEKVKSEMKIERKKLIDLLTSESARMRSAVAERNLKLAERNIAERDTYVDTTSAAWHEFAGAIVAALQNNDVVTWEMVPQKIHGPYGTGSLRFYEDPRGHYRKRGAMPQVHDVANDPVYRQLQALLRLLGTTNDETISTYALQKAGFNLEKLLLRVTREDK